jgi:hypothetical protein
MPYLLRKAYIGDGVYADFDGYYIWLYTSDGIEKSAKIALEPEVLDALNNFALEMRKGKDER